MGVRGFRSKIYLNLCFIKEQPNNKLCFLNIINTNNNNNNNNNLAFIFLISKNKFIECMLCSSQNKSVSQSNIDNGVRTSTPLINLQLSYQNWTNSQILLVSTQKSNNRLIFLGTLTINSNSNFKIEKWPRKKRALSFSTVTSLAGRMGLAPCVPSSATALIASFFRVVRTRWSFDVVVASEPVAVDVWFWLK